MRIVMRIMRGSQKAGEEGAKRVNIGVRGSGRCMRIRRRSVVELIYNPVARTWLICGRLIDCCPCMIDVQHSWRFLHGLGT